jgi:hypothetical protein
MEIHLSKEEFENLADRPWIIRPGERDLKAGEEVLVYVGLRKAGRARVDEVKPYRCYSEIPTPILVSTSTPRRAVGIGPVVAIRLSGFVEEREERREPVVWRPPRCPLCGGELSPGIPLWRCGGCGFAYALEEGGIVGPLLEERVVSLSSLEEKRRIEERTGVQITEEGWRWLKEHGSAKLIASKKAKSTSSSSFPSVSP